MCCTNKLRDNLRKNFYNHKKPKYFYSKFIIMRHYYFKNLGNKISRPLPSTVLVQDQIKTNLPKVSKDFISFSQTLKKINCIVLEMGSDYFRGF